MISIQHERSNVALDGTKIGKLQYQQFNPTPIEINPYLRSVAAALPLPDDAAPERRMHDLGADPEASRRAYGGEPLSDATLAFVLDPSRSVEDTVHHYFQPVHWSAAAGVPITYVLNERDRPIRPEMQQVMVQRLPPPVEVIRVDSGHLLPVTSPALFAEIVNRVAG